MNLAFHHPHNTVGAFACDGGSPGQGYRQYVLELFRFKNNDFAETAVS